MRPARVRPSSTPARLLSTLLVAGLLGLAGVAPARAGEGAGTDAPEAELARKWFETGALHHKLGEYARARPGAGRGPGGDPTPRRPYTDGG